GEVPDALACVDVMARRVLRPRIAVSDGYPEDHGVARDAHAVRERRAVVDPGSAHGRDEGDGPRYEGRDHETIRLAFGDRRRIEDHARASSLERRACDKDSFDTYELFKSADRGPRCESWRPASTSCSSIATAASAAR